jgi:hypothetical protein
MEKYKLAKIEEYIFGVFGREKKNKLLTRFIFDNAVDYANADLVRAFEDLEKKWHLLVRYTQEGYDWVHLTPEGMNHAGLSNIENAEQPGALPHPPKSST